MDIHKELKNIRFSYSFTEKKLYIGVQPEGKIIVIGMSRAEMFSLARFILRIAQKNPRKHTKTKTELII